MWGLFFRRALGTATWRTIAFLLLLIPSAQFAWRNRDMPQFAYLHDDGLFFVSAKSMAAGSGYQIESLPEVPAQTKFPPLFPYWLSLIWMLNPHFPNNLVLATLFCWLALVACLALAWQFFRELYGQDENKEIKALGLTALLASSPFMILFGSTMFSELPFTCLVLAVLLLARREGNVAIAMAGAAAGGAYLCRTAGIALVLAIPLVLLQKRDWKRIVIFAATSLPGVIGWSVWSGAHRGNSQDPTLLYYVDYLRYYSMNIGLDNFAVILWKNADQLLYSMGALILPKVVDSPPIKMLTEALGVAMITGLVRLIRRQGIGQSLATDYAVFALLSSGMLLVWHYPPNERFVLPIFPLLLAGFVTEMQHLAKMFRPALHHKDRSQRVVGWMFGGAVALLMLAAVGLQLFMAFWFLNQSAAIQRAKLNDRKLAYAWIAKQLPASSTLLSYDDPLLYLYTNRRGNYLPLPPRWWYAEDHTKIVNAYRDVVSYCHQRGLSYFYFTTDDLSRETGEDDRQAIETSVRHNPNLVPVFSAGIGTVYQVVPAAVNAKR